MSVDEVRRRAQLLAAPLAGAPCGADARFEPHHEAVRAEVAKLESPAGGPPDWLAVAKRGSELLEKQSKDILIASYTAHALLETEGALGLAVGLMTVNELIEQHWMGLYPPAARMRARSQALAWWLDKTGKRLAEPNALGQASSELLEHIGSELERLATLTRAKLDSSAPAVGPVRDALARAKLGGAASPAPATSAAATPAPAPSEAAPAPVAPAVAVDAAAAAPVTLEPQAPAPDASPAATPAAPAVAAPSPDSASTTPAASPEAQLDAQLDARAAPYLQPIKPDARAGVDARYDETYTRVRDAIQRLDMPVARPIDWKEVLGQCDELLKSRSKDLLIASHAAYALYDQKRIDGLITGLSLLHGLLREFWSELFPDMKRNLKGRSGALAWLLARFERFATPELDPTERALLPLLERSVRRLYAALDDLFVDQRPATTPMMTWLDRLTIAQASAKPVAAPSPAAPKPAQPAQPTAPKPATAAPTAAPASVSAPSDLGPAPSAANSAELNQFFSKLRNQLWDLATALRKSSDRDPLPYRLSRIASYLTLVEPPAHQNRKTQFPAPGPIVMGEVDALASKSQWDKLLGAAENTLRRNPYALDLHRHVHTAMGALGAGYIGAQRAVEGELQALLTRVPELIELRFDDDSPFASEPTVTWLTSLKSSGGGGASKTTLSGSEAAPQLEELEQARELVTKGRTDEALDLFHAALARLASGRERFRGRLAMARACASAGSSAMAVALFEGLVADLDRYSVDEWEPALASECLAGYHQCLKALAATDKEMAQTAAVVYRRLCRVDPKRALSGGAK